ncbi:MAG TPA: SDR family oxidoreductase [Mycobacterium sp.]|nr:SDR family oxidoreductase [Mycobacterium sp.]
MVGDLTEANLGLTDETVADLCAVDHIVHCAAIYDVTADEASQQAANVEGTRAVIELARRLDATPAHGRGPPHAPVRWTRSTGRPTSSARWRSWPYYPSSRRWHCPTPAAPTSCR